MSPRPGLAPRLCSLLLLLGMLWALAPIGSIEAAALPAPARPRAHQTFTAGLPPATPSGAPAVTRAPAGATAGTAAVAPSAAAAATAVRAGPRSSAVSSLSAGWNLISLTVQPGSTLLPHVLASLGSSYDTVFGFDPANGVTSYFTDPSKQILNNLTDLLPMHGYWLHLSAAGNLSITGTALDASSALTLVPGWNLVGFGGASATLLATALASLGTNDDVIFGYDRSQGGAMSWFRDPAKSILNNLTSMAPGDGYWVHLTSSSDRLWEAGLPGGPTPGQIQITMVVGTLSGSPWVFNGDIGGFTVPTAGGSTTFPGLLPGSYGIAAAPQAGYGLAVSCSSGATGTSSVSVSLAAGQTITCTFTATALPTVTGLSPAGGPTVGGTSVTIRGTSFSGATAVAFGTVPATSFTVTSPTTITAVSPAELAGAVDVQVTTSAGTSPAQPPADAFTFAVAGLATGATWPMFGHDLQHTRRSLATGPSSPTVAWRYQTGRNINSSAAIGVNGTVYIGSDNGSLYALNPNGSLEWRYQTGNSLSSTPAIAADGTLYFGSGDGYLYALNANGSLKWRSQPGAFVESSPALGPDGTVYVGSFDNSLYAINADGSPRWRYQTGGAIASSPVIGADGTIYAGSFDSFLYAINPNGSLQWRYQTGGSIATSPALGANGTVYVGSDDNSLYALDPSGSLKWRYQTGASVESSPAIAADGTVYFGSVDNDLYALNPGGSLKWRYLTGNKIYSSPAIGADGTVYVGSLDQNLYALDANGSLKWRYLTGNAILSSPAIGADGTVYLGSWDDYVYAIGPGTPAPAVHRTGSPATGSVRPTFAPPGGPQPVQQPGQVATPTAVVPALRPVR